MQESKYLLLVGLSAAAGSVAGILSNRKNPEIGALFGAAAGAATGAIAAALYNHAKNLADDGVDYYSETSPLYQGFDDIEME
jgi:stage V sporulation protein SpoVS